jgi:hypothetical protein
MTRTQFSVRRVTACCFQAPFGTLWFEQTAFFFGLAGLLTVLEGERAAGSRYVDVSEVAERKKSAAYANALTRQGRLGRALWMTVERLRELAPFLVSP